MSSKKNVYNNPDQVDQIRLIAIGKALRKHYVNEKRILVGKDYQISRRHDTPEYWRKAAAQCISCGTDPETYVRAVFSGCGMTTGPFPNMLGGPAAKGWVKKYLFRAKNVQGEKGSIPTASSEDVDNLRSEIAAVREIMYRMHGTWSMDDIRNSNYIADYSGSVPAYIKVLLGYPDPVVAKRFGKEACDYFALRPNMVNAGIRLGYPMREILLWTLNPSTTP